MVRADETYPVEKANLAMLCAHIIGVLFVCPGHRSPRCVSVDKDNKVKVNHVWAAGDVGRQIINPQAAESMGFGGVVEGVSHMQQEITLADGTVQQTNLHQHPLMRMKQVPPIEVYWRKTDFAPTGAGRAYPAADLAGGGECYLCGDGDEDSDVAVAAEWV
jgi:hypothetical protein